MTDYAELSPLPNDLITLLTDHLNLPLRADQLSATMTLDQLGIDSMALMELVVAAEEELGIVLPEDTLDMSPSSTLGDAAKAFHAAR